MKSNSSQSHWTTYQSPLGILFLEFKNGYLTQLCFQDKSVFYKEFPPHPHCCLSTPQYNALTQTLLWLESYFQGQIPSFLPPLLLGGSRFEKEVWEILLDIPYGKTMSYGQIAKHIAQSREIPKMSAQAVGMAASRNKIAIIIPCHRVIGKDGNLRGYAGGLDKKIELLKLEGILR
ncbi:MAG: methylated-DNA--[protein]-cysteine S-methyltransferase [Helicobacter sp.]|nr:methylated-DNA--[protein]-cysteine S-methyltransferase [Helicobacter sp.]MDY5740340.1 methylated-DNA--[protein]-cysteine S-methyltransferase [Helicobacter sp.]